jgi:biopolymer transport protein ExbB/TolQ
MNIPVVDMVLRAGWAARTILILLGIFSVVTWAVIFNRVYVLFTEIRRVRDHAGVGKT